MRWLEDMVGGDRVVHFFSLKSQAELKLYDQNIEGCYG